MQWKRHLRVDQPALTETWLDLWDAADRAGLPVGELARASRDRDLRVQVDPRGGGTVLVSAADVDAWVANRGPA